MAKVIKRKLNGMSWWMKTGIVLLLTMATTVLCNPTDAAAVTYYMTRDTATNLSADGTCNITGVTPYTVSTMPGKATTSTTEFGTASRFYPTTTANASVVMLNVYTPVYSANAVDISNITASVAFRGNAATDTIKLDLYDYDPAGAANNGTLVASSTAKSVTGGTTLTAYTWTTANFTLSGTGRVAQGHRLQFRLTQYSASATSTSRLYFGIAGTTASTNFTVTETPVVAVDSTPPVAGTFSISPVDSSNTFTSAAPTLTMGFTDPESTITGCVYSLNSGSTWTAATWTAGTGLCTATVPTQANGTTLNIQMSATSSGGTSIPASTYSRTVDTAGPADGTVSIIGSNGTNSISWTAATPTGTALRAANTYDVRFLTGATPPASCSDGTSIYSGTGFSTSQTVAVGSTNSYRVCAYDEFNLASIGATATNTNAAPAGPSKITSCNGCHGYKAPFTFTDGTAKNVPAGLFQGSHNTHVTKQVMDCASCHIAPATETSADYNHSDHKIQMAGSISGGTYSVASPITTSNVFSPGSCNTTSCHANVYSTAGGTSPAWGSAASGCSACHTVAIGVNGPDTGSHTAHAGSTCIDCHNAGTTATTVPSTLHADGSINVNNGYPVTAKHAAGSYAGTCSTASCHADPYGAGLVTTPVWGTSAGCAACHTGANAITATGPATGSHSLTGHAAVCTTCHADGTTATTVPGTGHADGNIDVANVGYPADKTKGTAGASCSSASCHVSPVSTALIATPTWGSTGNGCAACHTGANAITATGPATGSHALTGHAAACITCHAAGTTATAAPSTGHADGNIDVANVGYPLDKTKGTAGASCSSASCHVSPVSTDLIATPAWGSTGNGCAACHAGANAITATGPATGSHALAGHAAACITCHAAGTTATIVPSTGHADGNIDVANVGYPLDKTKGTAGASCSSASCHGSTSPAWGTTTTNDTCTKCHGIGTASVTAANEYVVAPSDAVATDTGKVSSLAKVGAHQTHLQLFNGLSQQGADAKARCEVCHTLPTVGTHATGSAAPTFTGIAAGGTYNAGTCSVYCHNPAGSTLAVGNAGSATVPLWTNANYIADGTLKTDTNCNTCHKSPGNPSFTSTTDHGITAMPSGIATDCSGCHGHNGGTGGVAGQQHMDGVKYGGGNCDSCHSYDTVGATYSAGKWTGGTWGKNSRDGLTPNEGFGAHNKHINYIKTRLGFVAAMDPVGKTYGALGTDPANVCGTCHSNDPANHAMGGSTERSINFGDGAFKMGGAAGKSLLFGADLPAQNPIYSGVSGTSSATTAKTCSNISCHYFTTPVWSAY